MKTPHTGVLLLIALGLSLAGLAAVVVSDAMRPPSLVWTAVIVANSPVSDGRLVVDAETKRRPTEGCTNGVQADIRRGDAITRLAAPERSLKADGEARYEVSLPDDIAVGAYSVRLRETFNCGGKPEQVESAWVAFEVVTK